MYHKVLDRQKTKDIVQFYVLVFNAEHVPLDRFTVIVDVVGAISELTDKFIITHERRVFRDIYAKVVAATEGY